MADARRADQRLAMLAAVKKTVHKLSPLGHSLAIAALAMLAAACSQPEPAEEAAAPVPLSSGPSAAAAYVGAAVCAECHEDQWQAFQGSHHDLALQRATPQSVLADFSSDAPSTVDEPVFLSADGRFAIEPDADSEALDVVYTFGVSPLQQYVVETERGRLQVLPYPWDTRPAAEGGQRWYALYPGEHEPGTASHWQGRSNSWNAMCADCHSTAVEKFHDPATGSYRTSYQEEDVACEACHGPGSEHVAAARAGTAAPLALATLDSQSALINACAPCHSRRGQLAEGFRPTLAYLDHYEPSLLREGLYHHDGQIRDEVYVYGSFLQSRMHLKGVSCSNCHDPHSARLILDGNAVCTQCHNPAGRDGFPSLRKASYDDPSHHLHEPDTAGSQCVSCHMPAETYMGVDVRHDHSFRIPRPDLSDSLDAPNTCNGCHSDEDAAWAAAEIEARFGTPPRHYGELFAAARRGEVSAEPELAKLAADSDTPIMVRATAVSLLTPYSRGYTLDTLRAATKGDALLRLGATEGAGGLSPESQWRLLSPLLDDEHLAVRTAAFRALVPLAATPAFRDRLATYLPAYEAALELTLDFPESQLNLANAYMSFGDAERAEQALEQALILETDLVPALLNLADLYRATLRDAQAQALLERALASAPEQPEPAFAYALWLTRQQRQSEALEYFESAAALGPEQVRFGYALALALNDSGQGAAAVEQLRAVLTQSPDDEDVLFALVSMLRDQRRFEEALPYLDQLIERNPDNAELQELRRVLSMGARQARLITPRLSSRAIASAS